MEFSLVDQDRPAPSPTLNHGSLLDQGGVIERLMTHSGWPAAQRGASAHHDPDPHVAPVRPLARVVSSGYLDPRAGDVRPAAGDDGGLRWVGPYVVPGRRTFECLA